MPPKTQYVPQHLIINTKLFRKKTFTIFQNGGIYQKTKQPNYKIRTNIHLEQKSQGFAVAAPSCQKLSVKLIVRYFLATEIVSANKNSEN